MLVPIASEETLERTLGRVHDPFLVVERPGGYELAEWDPAALATDRVAGYVPPCRLEHLGDRSFRAEHRVRFPYISGAMANGIGVVRDRRGDGPRRAPGDLRRGGAGAVGDRGRDRAARPDTRAVGRRMAST